MSVIRPAYLTSGGKDAPDVRFLDDGSHDR